VEYEPLKYIPAAS